jgi:predicted amidohydrolase YtcJ
MPDILLTNAQILSPEPLSADSVLLRAGVITAVGKRDALRAASENATEIDLSGRFLTPGLHDAHMHILPYGLDLATADLSPDAGVVDIPTLTRALREWKSQNPGSEWVLGARYNQNLFPQAKHPHKRDLDTVFPHLPVFAVQTSKHAAVANSAALKLAGIGRDTPNPPGGEIVRDADGEPTGVLLESAMMLVEDILPKPSLPQMVEAIRLAARQLARSGVTSAADMNVGWLDASTEVEAYRRASELGAGVRMTLFPHVPDFGPAGSLPSRRQAELDWGLVSTFGERPGVGGTRLGGAKLFADGALTVRTAAQRVPYIDGSGSGMLLHPPEELTAYIADAHRKGWQISVHAIGDAAVELVLDGFEAALRETPLPDHRHRIEHAMVVDDQLIDRMVRLNVIPVVQPEFLSRLGDAYILAVGEERAAGINPNRTMLQQGLRVAFSSDCPIVPGAPLDGMRAAIQRTTRSGRVLGAAECVSAQQALECYTQHAAWSLCDERNTGRIAVGSRADFTVIRAACEAALCDGEVEATIVGGATVYGSLDLPPDTL